jgi:catechol 2,3-dioxygenase-like lactoylglutathione lyase family enzyme
MPRPRLYATTPSLVVADLDRTLAFYAKLGFGEAGTWGEPLCFAMMNRDLMDLMFTLARDPDDVHPHGPRGVWDLYLKVTDLDAELSALRAAGVAIDRGPTQTLYRNVEIEVVDPDGHRICIAEDLTHTERMRPRSPSP